MILLSLLSACGDSGVEQHPFLPTPLEPALYSVNYPLYYFAWRIAGSQFQVVFPLPQDIDPAYWRPDPDIVAEYQTATLILLNGAGYANWVESASLPEGKLLNTSIAFRQRWISTQEQSTHSHGLKGQHSHADLAFTTWLDFSLAQRQAESIAEAIVTIDTEHAETYRQNYQKLAAELQQMDEQLIELGQQINWTPVVFSHPVYQYFERRYQINGRSVHWEPDKMPDAYQWREFDALLLEHPAKLMVWENQPLPEISAALAERGLQTVVFETAANRAGDKDFLQVMAQGIKNLQKVL